MVRSFSNIVFLNNCSWKKNILFLGLGSIRACCNKDLCPQPQPNECITSAGLLPGSTGGNCYCSTDFCNGSEISQDFNIKMIFLVSMYHLLF